MPLPASLTIRLAAIVVVAALAAVLFVVARGGDSDAGKTTVPAPPGAAVAPFADPFAYDPDREDEFEQRAARGYAHVLFAHAPGGVFATARRVARYRAPIEQAAKAAAVDPNLVEALVFLESGGIPDVVAGGARDLSAAVGLTQILAETGQNLLGMRVDVQASERLSRRIRRAERRGKAARARRLRAQRRRVDERFDPVKALSATARYLTFAKRRLGDREDLAFVSYHMGVGNLQTVLRRYGAGAGTPYVEVYFGSTPQTKPAAAGLLYRLGDESTAYWFKLLAAREIMRLYREDRAALADADALQLAKNSAEEVLHPTASTIAFRDPQALSKAWQDGDIVAIPDDPDRLGLRRDPRMGELAGRVGRQPGLYRGLRPEALAVALWIGAVVRDQSGARALTITSGVRDLSYQSVLVRRNIEATRNYSLHTTGYALDISRRYASRRQALAFQWALDRLQALNLIAWVREPAAIHLTVSADGARYLPLLGRIRQDPAP